MSIQDSPARYEIGLFAGDQELCAARGHFLHVYVDRESGRPVALPPILLRCLQGLL
jgi:acyl-CoA thioester hydrolase